jgi:cytochrome c biogenesis protein CcdA
VGTAVAGSIFSVPPPTWLWYVKIKKGKQNKIFDGIFMKSIVEMFVIICTAFSTVAAQSPHKLILHFFGSPTCGECAEIKTTLLQPLADSLPGKLDLRIYDIETDSGLKLAVKLEEHYKIKSSSPQELFFPDTFLLGFESIKKNAKGMIEQYIAHPEKWKNVSVAVDTAKVAETLKQRFEKFTFLQITLAGLVDGINPCAIATMIFLISFLAVQKRKRSEILLIGMTFTAAVFSTYLLLGLGAFKALSLLNAYHWIAAVVRWLAVAFAVVVAVICFRDAFVYAITRKAKDVKLQLSPAMKSRIHKTISGNLSVSSLFFGTLATGFLVTLLEAVCTGQVYLPTIILMTRAEGLRFTGWMYLIFYNFLFVLPLLIIMILAYYGLRWDELSHATQKHLPLLKTIMGIVLLGLAVFLAVAG